MNIHADVEDSDLSLLGAHHFVGFCHLQVQIAFFNFYVAPPDFQIVAGLILQSGKTFFCGHWQ